MNRSKPDYARFLSSRVNYIEPSPIREMISKVARKSREARVISFAAGDPDPDVVPREVLADLAREVFAGEKRSVIYSPTEGIPELREETARFMREFEGFDADPSDVIITLGSSQALDLVGRLVIDPGDIVVAENPSYVNTILAWRHYGAKILGIPMDDAGMRTDVLEESVRRLRGEGRIVKLVYTIPTGQNPTGITMSMDRRKHLLEIASKYDLLIVEDGAYNYIVYDDISIRSLKSMDSEGRVIFAGTYSKILGTGLRIGWLLPPRELVEMFKSAKGPTDMCPPVPSQFLAYHILRRGLFKQLREKAVNTYREKRDIMLRAIEKHMPGVRRTRPAAGMFIFLWLPDHINGSRFADEALERYSVAAIPGEPFYTDGSGKNTLRLNFSMPPKELIEEGIKRLGDLLREKKA